MSERFNDLKKVPNQPAARLLAAGNAKLKSKLKSPVSASVSAVLDELEQSAAWVDIVRLLSVALPARECVWWACLAGRDILGEGGKSLCQAAAETWVFEPTEQNRAKIQQVLETEASGDRASLCATAALYASGNLGPEDEMKDIPAPPGIVSSCAFGINLQSLKTAEDPEQHFQLVIDRAIDIARGGSGQAADEAAARQNVLGIS